MKMQNNFPQRRSIRLQQYNYAMSGIYFLTCCIHNMTCLLGEITEGVMIANAYGKIVKEEWLKTAKIRTEIQLGEYIVMPNHFHAIIEIIDNCHAGATRRPPVVASRSKNIQKTTTGERRIAPTGPTAKSIGAIISGFKSAVTTQINIVRNTRGTPVWHRNYYEHVIRNEIEYNQITEYILRNPEQWHEDKLHPSKIIIP